MPSRILYGRSAAGAASIPPIPIMFTLREAFGLYLPAFLLIGGLSVLSCVRDDRALSNPSPIQATAPIKR